MLDQYLGEHYRGPSMVLAAAGALDHDRIVELAGDMFGSLADAPDSEPPPATYRGGDRREPRELQETQIMVGFEGRPYTSDT
jgi:predicted Zn-dependent peptidase